MNHILKAALRSTFNAEAEGQQSTAGTAAVQANEPVQVATAEATAVKTRSPGALGERRGQAIIGAEQGILVAEQNEVQTRLDGVIEMYSLRSQEDRNAFLVQVNNVLLNADAKQHANKLSKKHQNYMGELRRASAAVEFFMEAKDDAGYQRIFEALKSPKGAYKEKIAMIPVASARGGSNKGAGDARKAVGEAIKESSKVLTAEEQKAAIEAAAKAKASGQDITATLSQPPKPEAQQEAPKAEVKAEAQEGEVETDVSHAENEPKAPESIREHQRPLDPGLESSIRTLADEHLWALAIVVANRLKACEDDDFQNLGAVMLDTMDGITVASGIKTDEEPAHVAKAA